MGDETRSLVKTWNVLKKELKDQFLPCNSSWIARESLRRLKHTCLVRDDVKEFRWTSGTCQRKLNSSILWQLELRRLGVKDLFSTIIATDGLLDYKLGNPLTSEFKENKSGGKNGKENDSKFKSKANDS